MPSPVRGPAGAPRRAPRVLVRSALAPQRASRVLVCGVLALCAAAVPGQSLPRHIDCGDLNGYPTGEPGWELLSASQSPPGISLAPAPVTTVHVAGNFPGWNGTLALRSDVLTVDPDQLDATHRLTALQLVDGTVLTISGLAPSTPYRLRLELGALSPWGELTDFFEVPFHSYYSSVSRAVRVELGTSQGGWRTAASGVRCQTGHHASTFGSEVSGIVPVWLLAISDATGKLKARIWTDGSDPPFLAGFELHAYESLPVLYKRNPQGPLLGAGPGVAPFVAAFNAGDLDGAEALALAMPDPFERGVALCQLAGWLDGSRDGRLHLLEPATAALQAALPGHPGAAWLLDELASLRRALDHLAASGRTDAALCPKQGGFGFLNKQCADQSLSVSDLTPTNANAHIALRELRGISAAVSGPTVLHDLAAWNNGTLPPTAWEPSPFVFLAARLRGTTLWSTHPSMVDDALDPESLEFAAERDALLSAFVSLGFFAGDFPQEVELLLFAQAAEQDKAANQWSAQDIDAILTPTQFAGAWWAPEVQIPAAVAFTPNWANLQRQQLVLARRLIDYWLLERLVDGEMGGGLGDDIELMGQLVKLMAGFQDQTDRRRLDALDGLVQHVLELSGEVQDGYFAGGLTDVEHSAEYTTNTWLALDAAYGHAPRADELALAVAAHLLDAQSPASAFAAPTSLGRLHFRSWYFTNDGPTENRAVQQDILLNGRSMYPGVATALRAPLPPSHPLLADLFGWARAWRDDALDTTGGKPYGWFGPVQWPSNEFGKNGHWWTIADDAAETGELSGGVASYTLELLRAAYHRSAEADRWTYLIPAARMLRSVQAWRAAGSPSNPPQGSAAWAAQRLQGSSRFGGIVLSNLWDLAADIDLNTQEDPLGGGQPYVDPGLVVDMRTWLEDEFHGQPATMKYALGPTSPCGTGFTAKPTTVFTGSYQNVISYYRVLYPLLTKHVIHTDRVSLTHSAGGGANSLLAATTGEMITEGIAFRPLVRWRSRLDDGLDLAIEANERDYGATRFSAFVHSFEADVVSLELQLDEGLLPGTYLVQVDAAKEACDQYPPGGAMDWQLVQKSGAGVPVQVSVRPGLNLVRVSRQGDALLAPSNYDLAVDPPVVQLVVGGGVNDLRLTTRVANFGSAPSPPATLTLYASLLQPDGQVQTHLTGEQEFLLARLHVPSLPPTAGWSMASHEAQLQFGITPAMGVLLVNGFGYQIRAVVNADGREGDLLDNQQIRGWLPADLAVVAP